MSCWIDGWSRWNPSTSCAQMWMWWKISTDCFSCLLKGLVTMSGLIALLAEQFVYIFISVCCCLLTATLSVRVEKQNSTFWKSNLINVTLCLWILNLPRFSNMSTPEGDPESQNESSPQRESQNEESDDDDDSMSDSSSSSSSDSSGKMAFKEIIFFSKSFCLIKYSLCRFFKQFRYGICCNDFQVKCSREFKNMPITIIIDKLWGRETLLTNQHRFFGT